jgi:hypothetical protein
MAHRESETPEKLRRLALSPKELQMALLAFNLLQGKFGGTLDLPKLLPTWRSTIGQYLREHVDALYSGAAYDQCFLLLEKYYKYMSLKAELEGKDTKYPFFRVVHYVDKAKAAEARLMRRGYVDRRRISVVSFDSEYVANWHGEMRKGHAAQVLAAIRNSCVHLLESVKATSKAAATRRLAAHPEEALLLLLG